MSTLNQPCASFVGSVFRGEGLSKNDSTTETQSTQRTHREIELGDLPTSKLVCILCFFCFGPFLTCLRILPSDFCLLPSAVCLRPRPLPLSSIQANRGDSNPNSLSHTKINALMYRRRRASPLLLSQIRLRRSRTVTLDRYRCRNAPQLAENQRERLYANFNWRKRPSSPPIEILSWSDFPSTCLSPRGTQLRWALSTTELLINNNAPNIGKAFLKHAVSPFDVSNPNWISSLSTRSVGTNLARLQPGAPQPRGVAGPGQSKVFATRSDA